MKTNKLQEALSNGVRVRTIAINHNGDKIPTMGTLATKIVSQDDSEIVFNMAYTIQAPVDVRYGKDRKPIYDANDKWEGHRRAVGRLVTEDERRKKKYVKTVKVKRDEEVSAFRQLADFIATDINSKEITWMPGKINGESIR